MDATHSVCEVRWLNRITETWISTLQSRRPSWPSTSVAANRSVRQVESGRTLIPASAENIIVELHVVPIDNRMGFMSPWFIWSTLTSISSRRNGRSNIPPRDLDWFARRIGQPLEFMSFQSNFDPSRDQANGGGHRAS